MHAGQGHRHRRPGPRQAVAQGRCSAKPRVAVKVVATRKMARQWTKTARRVKALTAKAAIEKAGATEAHAAKAAVVAIEAAAVVAAADIVDAISS